MRKQHVQGIGIVAGVLVLCSTIAVVQGAGKAPEPGRLRWEKHQLAKNLNEGMAIADVNKDGQLDLIAGPDWFEAPTWTKHPVREIGIGSGEFLQNNGDHAIDLNGDGWVDVLSASWFSDKIFWYENPGKDGLAAGKLWKQHPVVDGQESCEGTLMEDLDGDGVPELIVNSWNPDHPMTVVRIKPGKEGETPGFEKTRLGGPGFGHGAIVGDVNGDGRPDLWVSKGWHEQPAADWHSRPWTLHKDFDFDHLCLPGVIVDLTGDGKNDVILSKAHDYGLFWLEQGPVRDGRITWTQHEIDKSFSQAHGLVWADLDGDGRKELITGKRYRAHKDGDPGAADPVCLFRYLWNPAGKRFERDTISYDDGVGAGMQIRVADLDNDKRPDLAVAGKSGTYILFNRGPAQTKTAP